jgi:membrane protease YdiL (CAAX protease family)
MDEQPAQAPSVGSDYWSQSRRPLASLFLAGPLLVIYETGLICLGPSAMRNGAEAWLRQTLELLGFNVYFLLPALTVGILLGWHHVLRQPWHVSRSVLYRMAGECLGLALGLWLSWKLYRFLLQAIAPPLGLSGPHVLMGGGSCKTISCCLAELAQATGGHHVPMVGGEAITRFLGTISCYLGAGIYEELLFRLILLNLGIGLLAWMRAGRRASVIGGIVLTSVLFSAAHYIGPSGDPFRWLTFLFRFLAGVFFAVLFRYRGFGIAVGTHAFYDVLVGLSSLAEA